MHVLVLVHHKEAHATFQKNIFVDVQFQGNGNLPLTAFGMWYR